jgi:hypothetical protein
VATHQFKWWLYEDWEGAGPGEDTINDLVNLGGLPEPLARRLLPERPFYAVTLNCEVDDETLEVTILSATLGEE